MADDNAQTPQAAAEPPAGAQFSIKKLYVKDISFESPGAPEVFTQQWQPNLEFQINSEATQFSPTDFEVVLTGTVTVKAGESTAFLAEVQVAGIFAIAGLGEEEQAAVLGSYCPGILFPYLREAVSDLSVRGGFPQVVLAPVNFDALYAQHLAGEQGEAPAAG